MKKNKIIAFSLTLLSFTNSFFIKTKPILQANKQPMLMCPIEVTQKTGQFGPRDKFLWYQQWIQRATKRLKKRRLAVMEIENKKLLAHEVAKLLTLAQIPKTTSSRGITQEAFENLLEENLPINVNYILNFIYGSMIHLNPLKQTQNFWTVEKQKQGYLFRTLKHYYKMIYKNIARQLDVVDLKNKKIYGVTRYGSSILLPHPDSFKFKGTI